MEEESNPGTGSIETETQVGQQPQPIVETPEQQPVATEETGPSKEDLTKGIAKWRNTAKELEREVAKLRESVPAYVPTPTSQPLDAEAERGMQVIEDRMRAVVAPIQEKLDASEREQITNKFWSDPIAQAMSPEIQKEFSNLSPSMPYKERLDVAMGMAVRNNISAFQKAYEQLGVEKAYAHQAVKNGQNTANATGARVPNSEQKTLLERLQSGEIKPGSPEYIANRAEILRQEREQFGG